MQLLQHWCDVVMFIGHSVGLIRVAVNIGSSVGLIRVGVNVGSRLIRVGGI